MRYFLATFILCLLTGALVLPAFARVDTQEKIAPFNLPLDETGTTQAIVTFSKPGSATVRAVYFPRVPDLNSCHSLAFSAASKNGGESSAVCLDDERRVVGAFYCDVKTGAARCEVLPY
jgi:hypothetical protein